MFATRLKLAGVVRPYYGGSRISSSEEEASASTDAESPVEAATPAPKPAPISRSTPLQRTAATPESPKPPNPRSRVRSAAEAGGWGVLELGDDLQIDVPTGDERRQIVSVTFDRRDREDRPLITMASTCGAFDERNAAPLLRYSGKLPYGAFILERPAAHREEMVVLRAMLPADSASVEDLRCIIAELAARADKVECKITGHDHY